MPVPRLLAVGVHTVAAASLWIYLTQWQVYPPIEDAGHPYAAVGVALAVGILAQVAHDRIGTQVRRRWPSRSAGVCRAIHEVTGDQGDTDGPGTRGSSGTGVELDE